MGNVLQFLMENGLLNSGNNTVYIIAIIVIVALNIMSLAKRVIGGFISTLLLGVIVCSLFFVRVSIIDANGLNLDSQRVVSDSGVSMNYSDIEHVDFRDGKNIVLTSEDGKELNLKVDGTYTKQLADAIEKMVEKTKN